MPLWEILRKIYCDSQTPIQTVINSWRWLYYVKDHFWATRLVSHSRPIAVVINKNLPNSITNVCKRFVKQLERLNQIVAANLFNVCTLFITTFNNIVVLVYSSRHFVLGNFLYTYYILYYRNNTWYTSYLRDPPGVLAVSNFWTWKTKLV